MAATPEKTCLPQAKESKADYSELCPVKSEGEVACPNPDCSQDLLQQFNQLQERFQRTTNALASAAHDLKTPLAILNGYVELLQSEKLGVLNERQREILGDMRTSGQRLQQFIQDFLSFSVLEIGELKMHFEPADLNACLSEVCRLWSHSFQEKGLALYFLANEKLTEFALDVRQGAAGGFELARKCVEVHARGRDGLAACRTVHVGTAKRRAILTIPGAPASAITQPNSVKVSVSDTGPGIPREYHMEVFDDFFRLPQNESRPAWDLGLAIARRLVSGMGGKIWVESDPGAGCKFSFILPLLPPATAPIN